MTQRGLLILLALCLGLSACSTAVPAWRKRVEADLNELGRQGGPKLFPREFRNLLETFEHGDAVYFVQKDAQEADTLYRLAYQKSELLLQEVQRLKQQQLEEAQRRAAAEAARLEEERLAREAAEAEQRLLEQERVRALETSRQEQKLQERERELPTVQQQPARYTVRRGETLPQIAGRPEIYNDASLWPIIYRANRDQIRDPKRLWPGQVLAIPRHYTRDDISNARRYSGQR